MIFTQPIWLTLAIPVAVALWLWRAPSRLLEILRVVATVLILVAMAGPALRLPSRQGFVVVVADRSLSMPADSEKQLLSAIERVHEAMPKGSLLGVVAFGHRAVIERTPQAGDFTKFLHRVEREGSDLSEGLDKGLALIPRDAAGRLLLLSDGRWTGASPVGPASRAAARGIGVDYRLVGRTSADDLAVARIAAPAEVTPGESFMVTAWVSSPSRRTVTLELLRDGKPLAQARRTVPSGLSRHVFRDVARSPGVQGYVVRIVDSQDDPTPENNAARALVGVSGPKPALLVTAKGREGLAKLLRAGGIKLRVATPRQVAWGLADLAKYTAVLIENVPASEIGSGGMANLAAWARETGSGIMMTGGTQSYGPGGYYRSPLEPIMPLSMELRREHRKLSLAIVVALDRSGSMNAPVGGGKTKMDLANIASAEVLSLLSGADEFGVVAVDSSPHTVVPLAPANPGMRSKILSIRSMGGGIFVYTALRHAASMLADAKSGTKHIILFSDAADSEEPGKYKELLAKCRKANMTVSVIGLGKPTDVDADFIRDVAKRGGGEIYFTEKAAELPRIFAQDTFTVARSTFVDEPTRIRTTGGLAALTGRVYKIPYPVGGYNLCYAKPGANVAAVTFDEYKAPFIAAWQAGLGRVLCYTGEASGDHTGFIARWPGVGRLMTSLARWAVGRRDELKGGMMVTHRVRKGLCVVELHLDPERPPPSFKELPRARVARGRPGATPVTETRSLRWSGVDRLSVSFPLGGEETAISTVEVPGYGRVTLPPVCLPYSPEYQPGRPGEGRAALEAVARATGGQERVQVGEIWGDVPRRPRRIPIGSWLLFVAMALFLAEILERRSGLVSRMRLPAVGRLAGRLRLPRRRRRPRRAKRPAVQAPTAEAPPEEPKPQPEKKKEEPAPTLDAFQRAKRSARRRM